VKGVLRNTRSNPSSTRSGIAIGKRVWILTVVTGVSARRASSSPSRRFDSDSGSPPLKMASFASATPRSAAIAGAQSARAASCA
jgi:hypothetical protein